MMAYCLAKDVLDLTGYTEEDFNKVDPGAFKDLVTKWIGQADALIDADRRRSFNVAGADLQYAPLLENISMRITANIMAKAVQLRTSPVEKIDEFTARIVPFSLIDTSIQTDLQKLPCAPKIGMAICSPPRRHHSHEGD